MNSVGVSSSAKPPTGKMKARAPPPPPPAAPRPAPRRNFPPTLPLSQEDGDRSSGDQKENVLRDSLDVLLTLPGGIQKRTTVSGSKALMDLLVELCSQYHLSPVHHTLELQTRDAQPLAFKPNTLLGMLDVHTVLIKERVAEEKPKRPPPKLPEKTVRLVVNYHKTQKAVVRVSPVVPLNNLIPIICEKCEFDPRHIVLLSDSSSSKGLDLSKSLSDLGIRELYVLDHSLVLRSKIHSAPILNFSDPSRTSSVSTSVSDKKGLLGFFKLRRKSKTEEPRPMEMDAFDGSRYAPTTGADDEGNYTAPNTPGINSRECTIAACHSMGNISRLSPKSELKKRRAPPPPPPGSASMQNFQSVSLDDIQIIHDSPNINQQKKRRAPPPPPPTAPGSSGPTEETPLDRSRLMEVVESPCSDKEVPPESSPTQGGEEPSDVKRELTEEDAKCEANNKTAEEAENKRHSTMGWQGTQQEGCSDQKSEEEEEDEEEVPKGSPHTSDNTCITSDYTVSPLSFTHHECQTDGPVPLEEAASEDGAPEEKGGTGWCSPNRWSGGSGGQHPEDNDVDHCGALGLTAQLRQTLADLEADLAAREEVDGVSEASAFPSEVSYSEAEAAVPVTAIDEVCDEDVHCVSDEVGTSQTERMSHVGDYPQPVHVDISSTELCVSSNINGNHSQSYMQSDTEEEPIREAPPAKQEEPREASTIKKEDRDDDPADEMKTNANNQRAPKAEKPPVATEGVQPALVSSRRQLSQMLKSPDFAARVGMKTFTVVPPKPVVKPYREREAPTVSGAIKIDDQGNLILPETANHKPTKSTGAGGSANGSLLRKAKAFWSSAEQELNVEEHKMGAAEPKTCNSQTSVTSGTSALPRDETTQSREFKEELVKPTWDAGKRNTSMYEQPIKPPQTLLLLSDNEIQAEFPFRKPIRRTSSQYIASAIAKCSKVPQSVSEPVQFQAKNVLSSVPEKGKHVSHSPHLENGESNGRLESERHKGPLDELSEKEELGIPVSIIDQWTPQPAGNPEINNATSSFKERVYEGTWKNTQDNSKSENVTGVNTDSDLAECHRSPLQFPTSYLKLNLPPQSRLGPSTSLENMQSNELRAEAAHGLRPTGQSSCLTGPIAKSALKSGSLFGPVRKFRPIHLKPLQKEASLHSSLMEAIQAGEGKERLRKTPDPIKSADHQKPSFVEAEGQRSQLLAAIRAQNGISGLRKISSTASTEISHVKNLENVQNAANGHSPSFPAAEFSHSKEKQVDAIHADAGSNHLKKMTSESLQEHSPLATEGDFPVESCPPPPPPLPNQHSKLSQPRLPSAACANSGAREALMEAIRTGAGAAQLKKVPVPSKTVLVNGRLGTMQASLGS